MKSQSRKLFPRVIAIVGLALLSSGFSAFAQQAQSQVMTTTTSTDTEQAPKIPNDELDSLVAPIALYSDPLLAQTLAASTYPLEMIQLQQWMDRNKNLKGKALAEAVAKQPWDPSVQAMAGYPEVLDRMAGNVQWTTDLGNAFLAQQSDVMSAVQRMRAKAQGTGNLKTSAQQKVETQTVEGGKQVIVVEQANPDVVYVPSYDPVVVYGPPPPAYPYYPYTYPGYYAGMGLAFGTGLMLGAAWGGAWGHWGDCDWHGGDVNINNNNNFNRNVNRNVNRGQAGQGNRWQHNPQHRGNAPYGDRNTANKFGGRGPGGAGRPGGAGGVGGAGRPGGVGGAGGVGGVGKPGGAGGVGGAGRPGGAGGAGGVGGIGKPGGAGGGGAGARPAGGSAKNQIGNHSASSRPSSASHGGGFGGGSGNYARASSSRGGHSMGGGGMSRGGGGGGGHRGGGGGGRGGGGGGRRR